MKKLLLRWVLVSTVLAIMGLTVRPAGADDQITLTTIVSPTPDSTIISANGVSSNGIIVAEATPIAGQPMAFMFQSGIATGFTIPGSPAFPPAA